MLIPAVSYHILADSYNNQQLINGLDLIWGLVGIVTPVDEFYILGQALKLASKTGRSTFRLVSRLVDIKSDLRATKLVLEETPEAQKLASQLNKSDDYIILKKSVGADIAGKMDEGLEAILNKKLSDELKAHFINDYNKASDFRRYFDEIDAEDIVLVERRIEAWEVFKKANVDEAILLGKNGELDVISKYLNDTKRKADQVAEEIKKLSGGYQEWFSLTKGVFIDIELGRQVNSITLKWADVQKVSLAEALKDANSNLLGKINNLVTSTYYSKNERVSYELYEWALTSLYKNKLPDFSRNLALKDLELFRNWRFISYLDKPNTTINISLGIRFAGLQKNAQLLKSTSFETFLIRGFNTKEGVRKTISEEKIWLNGVSEALKLSFDRGGKVYFHIDKLDDFSALYNPSNKFFNGGTIKELKYLVDNGLYDKGKVFFKIGTEDISPAKLKEIDEAIKKWIIYRDKDPLDRSFKGRYHKFD